MKKKIFQEQLIKSFTQFKDRIALQDENRVVTYAELDKRSGIIAGWIIGKGIAKGTFIGVLMEDRLDLITILTGIIKAGCVMVPLYSGHPTGRIRMMFDTTRLTTLFIDKENAARFENDKPLRDGQRELVFLQEVYSKHKAGENRRPCDRKQVQYSGEDPFYIHFTSGTTGAPRAVIGKNKSLLHFLNWEIDTFHIDCTWRVAQFTIPGFDPFLRDVFAALLAGGIVVIPANKDIVLDPAALRDWLNKYRINMIHCVSSLFRLLCLNSLTAEDFKDLKSFMLAGEKVTPADLVEWYKIFGERIRLANCYGPTETTMSKVCHMIEPADVERERIPIGKPIPGARVIILDKKKNVCDELEVGEIAIRTPFRSCGYYDDPELNRRKFIPNPFNDNPDDIIYLSGDLGRLLPDGNIDILGRVDRQVKIRGYRVELDEIEGETVKFPGVREAVVLKKELSNSNELLYGFITLTQADGSGEEDLITGLRAHLSVKMPDYMVPARIKIVDDMPRNSRGKVDYEALYELAAAEEREILPPRNAVEETLLALWSEILGMADIGVTDNFFDLGGNSLSSISLLSRIHKEFDVGITIKDIFDNITIEKQAECIAGRVRDSFISIDAAEKKEYYPLSPAQNRLYILQQMELQSTAYNIQQATLLSEEQEETNVEEIFRQLIVRHESLRTSFRMVAGEPVQKIHDPKDIEFKIEVSDVGARRAVPETDHRDSIYQTGSTAATQHLASQESESDVGARRAVPETDHRDSIYRIRNAFIKPFDLSRAPLLRVGLLHAGETGYFLVVDMHHIISDGLSIDLLTREFLSLNSGDKLSPVRLQYRDYARWQNETREQEILEKQEQYWLEEFAGDIPVLDNLPIDFKRPESFTFTGHTISFRAAEDEVRALRELGRAEGVTMFMLLLAAFNVMLGKVSGREDIVIGIPTAGRRHHDLEGIVGMFVNTLALRNYPVQDKTFKEFLVELRHRTIAAFENQDYQFEDLVDKIAPRRDTGRNPLFDVLFVLNTIQGSAPSTSASTPAENGTVYRDRKSSAKFDLILNVMESGTGIFFTFQYRTRIFKEETVRRFIEYFRNVLRAVIDRSGRRICEIEMIPEQEREQIIFAFNDTDGDYLPYKTIHEMFAEQAEKTPHKIALLGHEAGAADVEQGSGVSLTYPELNLMAGRLAGSLIEKGVETSDIVGVMPPDPTTMVVAVLAIWKAGGAFLPIEPDTPDERKEYMLKDSCAKLILTGTGMSGVGVGLAPTHDFPDAKERPQGLAYAIYTSGSTGQPKGVLVRHDNITNQLQGLQKRYAFEAGLHHILLAPFTFDPSVQQVFLPLISGGKLHLVPRSVKEDPAALLFYIVSKQMDIVNTVPSLMELLLNHTNDYSKLHFKYIILAGEIFSAGLHRKIRETLSVDKLINIYGPTEATINTTLYECGPEVDTIPIGKPLMNYRVFILDKNLNIVPLGVNGEICIAGAGIARGYLNNPELTAEKFASGGPLFEKSGAKTFDESTTCVEKRGGAQRRDGPKGLPEKFLAHLFSKRWGTTGGKLYKTGDFGKWLDDGNIQFLGRMDQQVKIRGIRVELEEIETQLLSHKKIKQAVVIAKKLKADSVDLCAYYVADAAGNPKFWPAVGDYFVWDDLLYNAMSNDHLRNKSFKAAINRLAKGKTVVEIGTGPDAILARFCAEAGVEKVYAVEILEEYYKKAKETVRELGLEEKIVLIHGDAAEVQLPEKVDICLANQIGVIGSSEGGIVLHNNARRFLKDNGLVIPGECITRIAGVCLPEALHKSPEFSAVSRIYPGEIFKKFDHPFDLRLSVENFPKDNVISNAENFEELNLLAHIEPERTTTVNLIINKDTRIDGFLLWLNLHPVEGEVIDSLNNRHSWLPVFVPVFYPGVQVSQGDSIRADCTRTLSENELSPDYRIKGILQRRQGQDVEFDYRLPYFETGYKANPFYRELFKDDRWKNEDEPEAKAAGLMEDDGLRPSELRNFLKKNLPGYMIPAYFLQLDEMPLTTHGKVDLKALPDIGPGNLKVEAVYAAPVSEIEKTVAAIWQDVLQLDTVGIDDNFFDLGGTSLDIIKVNGRLQDVSDKKISVVSMFKYPTIRTLTAYFSQSGEETAAGGIDRTEALERGKRDRKTRLQKRKQTTKN